MSQAPVLNGRTRKILKRDDPELLHELTRKADDTLEILYPEPVLADITTITDGLRGEAGPLMDIVAEVEQLRYGTDETPEKFKRQLEGNRRIRSNLTDNEIQRVASMITRNPYEVHSPTVGEDPDAVARADKRQQWGSNFFPAMERKGGSLRRMVIDSALTMSYGAYELYRTDSYDKLGKDLERREGETDQAYKKRTDPELMKASPLYGLRAVTAKNCWYRKDDEGVEHAVISDWKAYRYIYVNTREKYGQKKLDELKWPKPGDPGWQSAFNNTFSGQTFRQTDSTGNRPVVETIRYYDRCWYAYIVGSTLVELKRHHFRRVPVFPVECIPTSSDLPGQRTRGLTFGTRSLEFALNDRLTADHDRGMTFGRPKPVVETAVGGKLTLDRSKRPARIDLSDPRRTPQLNEGQRIVDAYGQFKPDTNEVMLTTFINLFQRSGQNPIAQGASPGADPAGYTVATLVGQVNDLYGIVLLNDARVAGEILDTVVFDIRDYVEEVVYLPVFKDSKYGNQVVTWLALDPEDVDECPFAVTCDPTDQQNKLARVQTYTGGWKDGVISRRRLQQDGYDIQNHQEEDDQIIVERVLEAVVPFLVDNALSIVMAGVSSAAQQSAMVADAQAQAMAAQGGGSGLVGADGSTPISSGAPMNPASPQPPTVGAGASAASQQAASPGPNGGGRLPVSRAMAGQNQGYVPPAGQGAPPQRGG